MLDLECFTYLNRALESSISPIVILASNRGVTTIRGTAEPPSPGIPAAHGIPPDLLARLLIIPTHPYSLDEVRTIIGLRAKLECITVGEQAMERVASNGVVVSLRYALQLLTPASILARVAGRKSGEVGVEEVEECEGLFIDARRSAGIVSGDGLFVT